MWCTDPFLSSLKAFGYSVVRLPSVDLGPLQLLLRTGRDLERLGRIETVLLAGPHVGPPAVATDRPAASMACRRTGQMDAGVGVTLLANVVAGMGGSPRAIEAAYRRARTIAFEFSDVVEDSVSVADLDRYLADARVTPRSSDVAALLESDDLYVTTAVVKSRRLTILAQDDEGARVEIDLARLCRHLGPGPTAHLGSGASVTYTGPVALGFGFRALRLFYDEDRYRAVKPVPPGEAALGRRAASPEWLESESAFARLRQPRRRGRAGGGKVSEGAATVRKGVVITHVVR